MPSGSAKFLGGKDFPAPTCLDLFGSQRGRFSKSFRRTDARRPGRRGPIDETSQDPRERQLRESIAHFPFTALCDAAIARARNPKLANHKTARRIKTLVRFHFP
jgi:hypothetical protein